MIARLAQAGLLLSCLLTGCANLAPLSSERLANQAGQTALSSIDLGGRLSARFQVDGKDQAIHGSFTWSQRGDHTFVTLLSPLGQTLATIDIAPDQTTLMQSGKAPRSAVNPDTLAMDALGWPLPLSGLRNWLQGQVVDAAGQRTNADPNNPAPIRTGDGWQLLYANWDATDPALPVHPKRIDLTRTTPQAGEVAIRIVIDSWQPA
ncbi:outer membrane lipoprotein LolB [Actimicrobium sp. GrIS 1.19]|uniref:lipoprotein insertase outer membrane protein LolB n=1 Tax=Actimicrobium sp. GrIS 1.19 TaxID=3071708 RepID=UPI002E01CE64|nr:outer membrane lipoprotein LolB [Actimicrobium sp. GrIS 1.19]